jgi:hypothetical protein
VSGGSVRLTKRLWVALLLAIVLVLAVSEVILTVVAFASLRYRHDIPKDFALQRLLLTKWLVLPFLAVDPRLKPYTGGRQRYLGDLTYDSAEWIELISPDALLGSRLGRNITAFENMGLGDMNGSVYVTNDEGFASIGSRDFHYGLAHSARRYRIIIVGGSTVFGWGAGNPDRNLPARLNSSLKRSEPNRYEVINGGVPGYDSAQEFLYVASELIHYKPDLLIVYNGWNDEFAGELDPSIPAARDTSSNWFKTKDHLLIEGRFRASYSVLGSAQLFAGNVVARAGAAIHHTGTYWLISGAKRHVLQYFIPDRPTPQLKYDPARWEKYEENLTNMLSLADKNGVRVALFLQPIMWIDGRAPTPEETPRAAVDLPSIGARQAFYAEARPMFARLRERRQRPAQVCIEDLSQILRGTTETIYGDSGHLLGRGNAIVADEIVKRLSTCGVLAN